MEGEKVKKKRIRVGGEKRNFALSLYLVLLKYNTKRAGPSFLCIKGGYGKSKSNKGWSNFIFPNNKTCMLNLRIHAKSDEKRSP